MTYLHASRAIIGDGKIILSLAQVGFDGKFITYVDSQKPLDATSEDTREFGGSITLTPDLMNIHDHISRKPPRFPAPGKTFDECTTKLMDNDLPYSILHSYVNMLSYLKDESITHVRDQGLTGYTCINLRWVIEKGLVTGPYISSYDMFIGIIGGHRYCQNIECDGPDAVRRAVCIQCNKGADVTKFMGSGELEHFPQEDSSISQFTLEELRAGTDAVHDLGCDCAIHAYSNEGIRRAVLAGIDHTEHGCMTTEDLIEEMVKHNTHLNPTMTGIRGVAKTGPNTRYWDMPQEHVPSKQEQGMRWARAASIPIGADADTVGTFRDEIATIADVLGEGPVEAIDRATGTNVRITKHDDMRPLEVGRPASIAAFDGDLTKSLDGLTRVVQTWKGGTTCK